MENDQGSSQPLDDISKETVNLQAAEPNSEYPQADYDPRLLREQYRYKEAIGIAIENMGLVAVQTGEFSSDEFDKLRQELFSQLHDDATRVDNKLRYKIKNEAIGGLARHKQIENIAEALPPDQREELIPYVEALREMLTIKNKIFGEIFSAHRQFKSMRERDLRVKFDDGTNPVIHKLQIVKNRVAPLDKMLYEEFRRISFMEGHLFGGEAEIASQLWKTSVYLRSESLPGNVSMKKLQAPLVRMLGNKEYDSARLYVEELIAKYPKICPDFVAEELNIDPNELRQLLEDEDPAKRRMELKKARELNEQREFDQAVAIIQSLYGKELVAPDGSIITLKEVSAAGQSRPRGVTFSGLSKEMKESLGIPNFAGYLGFVNSLAVITLLGLHPKEEAI